MSLFGSLQTASNTLQAVQIGLQVSSNNIANANTEGFIRERVNYAPAPVQEVGNLSIGLGVQIEGITQQIDNFLANQLRDATGERISADLQSDAFQGVEQILGELSEGDLSTAITSFFNAIQGTTDAVNGDPRPSRLLVVSEGQSLASEFRRIDSAVQELRNGFDDQIASSVAEINALAESITELNIQITQTEAGQPNSQAGALRSARNQAVNDLAEILNVTVNEQPSGGLAVAVGGEFLVFEGQRREVTIENDLSNAEPNSVFVFADTGSELQITSGRIQGLTAARDQVVDGFRDELDSFAATLISEFNLAYSQGQGLEGFTSLTSFNAVDDPSVAIDQAGLEPPPSNGQFVITVVTGDSVGSPQTIEVDLLGDGQEPQSTLNSVAAQINGIEGLNASVESDGRLTIETDREGIEFTFSQDTSGLLAALGLNTFFTGSSASDININPELDGVSNVGKLALALQSDTGDPNASAVPRGTAGNAEVLAELIDQPVDSLGGASIIERFDQVINELAQQSSISQSVAEGLAVFEATLESEFQAVSGVNIDEEAIDLITLQRVFQATARVIQTIQELLDTLVTL